jgi:hypothetical protein
MLQVKATVGATGVMLYLDTASNKCYTARLGRAMPFAAASRGEWGLWLLLHGNKSASSHHSPAPLLHCLHAPNHNTCLLALLTAYRLLQQHDGRREAPGG